MDESSMLSMYSRLGGGTNWNTIAFNARPKPIILSENSCFASNTEAGNVPNTAVIIIQIENGPALSNDIVIRQSTRSIHLPDIHLKKMPLQKCRTCS